MINICYIIFIAVAGLKGAKNVLSNFNLPSNYFLALLLFNIIGFIGSYLIYCFKKSGVYIVLAEIVIQLLTQRIYGYMDTDILFSLFLLSLGSVSIISRWKEFS